MQLVLKVNLKDDELGFDGIASWARGTKKLGDHEFEIRSLGDLYFLAEHFFNASCSFENVKKTGVETPESLFYKGKINP